jgi:hypothetical protein
VGINIMVFWDVVPYRLVYRYKCFEGTCEAPNYVASCQKTIILIFTAERISNQDVRNFSYLTPFMSTFNLVKIGSVWHSQHLEKTVKI